MVELHSVGRVVLNFDGLHPSVNGLPQSVALSTLIEFAGILQPFLRDNWIRSGTDNPQCCLISQIIFRCHRQTMIFFVGGHNVEWVMCGRDGVDDVAVGDFNLVWHGVSA